MEVLQRRSDIFSATNRHRRWGQPRYGFRVVAGVEGNGLEPDPDEQKIVSLIRRLRVVEGRSWREITDELNERGYRTRSGGSWFPNTVRRVFSYGNRPYRELG